MPSWMFARAIMIGAGALALCAPALQAQPRDASAKPIRVVVPFAPSGYPDRLGRVIAKHLSEGLQARVYVENRPGAGGITGATEVMRSAPDGATLLISSLPSHVIAPLINPNVGYDPVTSFTHIAYIGGPPSCFVVSANSKLQSFADLLRSATAGPLTYGTAGVGTVGHLLAAFVAQQSKVQLNHVPYTGPMIPDIMTGVVDIGSLTLSTLASNIEGGNLRLLAVASSRREARFPNVPTFKELGYDIGGIGWLALSGPAGLDSALVQRINGEVRRILTIPDVGELLRQEMIDPISMTPQELVELIRSDVKNWTPLIAAAGLKK